jgi:O-acetyl-ADP-ribose deacetylase (regulator of RNase III)
MNPILREKTLPSGQIFQIVQGDITAENVDAIVNAANERLEHGGGVAWALSRAGGPKIQIESAEWVQQYGLVSQAEPAYTTGGKLACRYVIHAVGPILGDGDEDVKLTAAIRGALWRADQLMVSSIALPAISTGIHNFPKERAAKIIITSIEAYFSENPASSIKLIRLTLLDQHTVNAFLTEWGE